MSEYHFAAFALIRNDRGEVLFKRRRDVDLWDLPGGKADAVEMFDGSWRPEATCEREVWEETDCRLIIEERFGEFLTAAVLHPHLSTSVVFTGSIRGQVLHLNSEASEFGWFTYQTLPENTFSIHADILRQYWKGKIDRVDLRELVVPQQRVLL